MCDQPIESGVTLTAEEVRAAEALHKKLEAAVRVLAEHYLPDETNDDTPGRARD